MSSEFNQDYNLDNLIKIKPSGDTFEMFVTPRFSGHYSSGYEVLSSRLVRAQLASCDLFIDVGAHYGYYSLLAAHSYPLLKTVAIEPVQENITILRKNIGLNSVSVDRMSIIQAAVSSRRGRELFCKSQASDNCSFYPHPATKTLDRVEVETICLDDIVASHQADRIFLKIDTDGHELDVLKGFEQTLNSNKDVTILFEMNPKMMKIAGVCCEELLQFISSKNLRLFGIDDIEGHVYPLEKEENIRILEGRFKRGFYNILCIPERRSFSVALFSHTAEIGGAERSLIDLVHGLVSRGVVCNVVLPCSGPLAKELIDAGSGVFIPQKNHRLWAGWWWADTAGEISGNRLADTMTEVERVIVPELRNFAPDVIYSNTIVSPWGAYCAEELSIPHALSVREYGELDHDLFFLAGLKQSISSLYAASDAVFCISNDVRKELFPEDPLGKVSVVFSGLDSKRIVVESEQRDKDYLHDSSRAEFKIGIFASICRGKGQLDLVKACTILAQRGKTFVCYIVGDPVDPNYEEELRSEIESSGLKDFFVFPGFDQKPYALMKQMNVVVSCSVREALGRTLIEALFLGIPIIYPNSGGPAEIFEDKKHGMAYNPGDYNHLASIIEDILASPGKGKNLVEGGTAHLVKNFSHDAYVDRIAHGLIHARNSFGSTQSKPNAITTLLSEHSQPGFRSKLYIGNSEEEFCEQRVVQCKPSPYGICELVFTISGEDSQYFRLDPVEGSFISLEVFDVWGNNSAGEPVSIEDLVISTNGEEIRPNLWEFQTADPQIFIKSSTPLKMLSFFGNIIELPGDRAIDFLIARDIQINELQQRYIEVRGSLVSCEEQIAELTGLIGVRDEEIVKARDLLDSLVSSHSWRITVPLRGLNSYRRGLLNLFRRAVRLVSFCGNKENNEASYRRE